MRKPAYDPPIDTLFFVGTGAVKNSWTPVIEAIHSAGLVGNHLPAVGDGTAANSLFVVLVNMRRHFYFGGQDRRLTKKKRGRFRHAERQVGLAHRRLKDRIAVCLDEHSADPSKEFALRKTEHGGFGFDDVVKKMTEGRTRWAFVTTNWDNVIESGHKLPNGTKPFVLHVHGNARRDRSLMLLPGEIVAEPYRSNRERRKMERELISSFYPAIESTRRLVIYGHAVAASEAELRIVMQMGLHGSIVDEIVIVNTTEDILKAVASQIKPLIAVGHRPSMTGYTVNDLDTPINLWT